MRHRTLRNPKTPTEAKISNLANAVLVNQDILGFQIPVEYPSLVQELHSLQNLEQQRLE
jgi:hypothetical protein